MHRILSNKEFETAADRAGIVVSADEKTVMQAQIDRQLAGFDVLQNVDTKDVAPFFGYNGLCVKRTDE